MRPGGHHRDGEINGIDVTGEVRQRPLCGIRLKAVWYPSPAQTDHGVGPVVWCGKVVDGIS